MAILAGSVVLPVVPGVAGFAGTLKRSLTGGAAAASLAKIGLAAGAVVGSALAVGAAAAFKLGDTFNEAFKEIRIGTGATGRVLEGLKGDFREVFRSIPTDTGSASKAIADLNTRLGLTGRPLQEVSKRVIELSRLTGEDLNSVIPATTRLIGDWGVKTRDMPAVLDSLFRASQATGIGIGDLSQQMVQFGSPLRQLGFSFEFSAAMFSNFEKAGVATQTLMPGLRFALKNLSKPTDELGATMQQLGIDIEEGPDKALAKVFEAIKAAPSDLEANGLAFQVFGQRSGPDMAAAIREGKFELDDLMETISSGEETILGAAKDTRTWRESWQVLTNNGMLLFEPVATRVFEAVGGWMAWLVDVALPAMRKFGDAWSALGGDDGAQAFGEIMDSLLGDSGRFVDWFRGVGNAVLGVIDAIDSVRNAFRSGADDVGPGGPLGQAFDSLADFIAGIWPPVVKVVSAGVDAVVAVFRAVGNFLAGIWDRVGGRLVEIAKSFIGALAQTIRGGIDIFRGIFDIIAAVFTGDWERAWDGVQRVVTGGWNVIQGIFRAGWQVVTAIVRLGLAVIQTLWSGAWTRIWNSIKSFWKVVDRLWKAGWSAVGRVVVSQWKAIARIVTAGWRGIARWLTRNFRTLQRWWTRGWEAVRDVLRRLWEAMRDQVTRIWDSLRDRLRRRLSAFTTLWRNVWRAIWEGLRDRWNDMRDLVTDRMRNIRDRFNSWSRNLRTAWRNFWGGVKDVAFRIWGDLKSRWDDRTAALRDRVSWLVDRVRSIWARIRAVFRDPINWVIRNVWNRGIVKAWNFIAKRVGFGTLSEVDPIRLQRGGPVGGQGRGDRIPALLEPGEYVVNRRSTSRHRALLELLNRNREGDEDGLVNNLLKMRFGGIIPTGRAIQRMGFSVGEHPSFGGVAPVHVDGSWHYRAGGAYATSQGAIDVNWRRGGSEASKLDFLRSWILQNVTRANIRELLWRVPGHLSHLHLAMSSSGGGSFFGGIAGALQSLWQQLRDRVRGIVDPVRASIASFAGQSPFARLLGGASRKMLSEAFDYIRERARESFSGGGSGGGGAVRGIVQGVARSFGWGRGGQWNALTNLITRESGWRPTAQNPRSTAYGLFQFLNSTWAGTGIGKTSDPRLQTIAGLRYIRNRYGTPAGAWNFWQRNSWYDDGGYLPPGVSMAINNTGQFERVLAPGQVDSLSARLGAEGLASAIQPYTLRPGDQVQFVVEGQPLTATVRRVLGAKDRSDRQRIRAGSS